jgi:hypothetical protein
VLRKVRLKTKSKLTLDFQAYFCIGCPAVLVVFLLSCLPAFRWMYPKCLEGNEYFLMAKEWVWWSIQAGRRGVSVSGNMYGWALQFATCSWNSSAVDVADGDTCTRTLWFLVIERNMKACSGRRGISLLLILKLVTRCMWFVNFTSRPVCCRKRTLCTLTRRLGGPQSRSWRLAEEKNLLPQPKLVQSIFLGWSYFVY